MIRGFECPPLLVLFTYTNVYRLQQMRNQRLVPCIYSHYNGEKGRKGYQNTGKLPSESAFGSAAFLVAPGTGALGTTLAQNCWLLWHDTATSTTGGF
jgi:hypothetical protein